MAGMLEDFRPGMELKEKGLRTLPKFLGRRYYQTGDPVPRTRITAMAGAYHAIARAIGPGGGAYTPVAPGRPTSGGIYARVDFACTPGEHLDATLNSLSDVILNFRGQTILRAPAGRVETLAPIGDAVGDIIRQGTLGTNDGNTYRGGNSGTDLDDPDSIGLFGLGVECTAQTVTSVQTMGFGGGAARHPTLPTGFANENYTLGGNGILVIEYWSADPRGIIT